MTNARGSQASNGGLRPDAWQRRRSTLARSPGVATVSRALPRGRVLPLAYVRSGPRDSVPVLVIPGGPGVASVLPYQRLRAAASRAGLGVLMVEHRGVGMSRKSADGSDISPEDITVREVLSDLAAVLDAEGLDRAPVYGASYGSYLAGAFATRFPHRVSGMVLDSPVLDAQSTRANARELNRLYWHGGEATGVTGVTEGTDEHAARVRALVAEGTIAAGEAGFPIQLLHESGGPELVARLLGVLESGKGARAWRWLNRLGASDVMRVRPFFMEFDLVARAAFTELGYGLPHDPWVGPLRSEASFGELAAEFPAFAGEPVDIRRALASFDWPTLVLSGDRDVRTPRTVAEQIVAVAPHAALLPIAQHGHSALDTAEPVALDAMLQLARADGHLPRPAGANLTGRRPAIARLISARLALARVLP